MEHEEKALDLHNIDSVIFDMDGVVTRSAGVHAAAGNACSTIFSGNTPGDTENHSSHSISIWTTDFMLTANHGMKALRVL